MSAPIVAPNTPQLNNHSPVLAAALAYAELGFPVVPCHPNTKVAARKWKEQALTDPEEIRQWYNQHPDGNLAIATLPDSPHIFLDLDTKNADQDGIASFLALNGGVMPAGPLQKTPSGGQHLITKRVSGLRNTVDKGEHKGIDIKNDTGYILVEPSTIDGKPYKWTTTPDTPLVELPITVQQGLRKLCEKGGKAGSTGSNGAFPPVPPAPATLFDITPLRASLYPSANDAYAFITRGTVAPRFGGDRSRALFGACEELARLTGDAAAQVLYILVDSPYAMEVAMSDRHSPSNPIGWLWKYNVCGVLPPSVGPVLPSDTSIGFEDTFVKEVPPPKVLIPDLIPVNVFGLAGQGGVRKTTLMLYIMICVILKLPVFGRKPNYQGKCLFVTGEDKIADTRFTVVRLCAALKLTPAQQQKVGADLHVVEAYKNLTPTKLLQDRRGVLTPTDFSHEIIATYKDRGFVLAAFDPVSLLGPGESTVNDGAAALMGLGRLIGEALGDAAVGFVQHTGKTQARDAVDDMYSGRGASAYGDNARAHLTLNHYHAGSKYPLPPTISEAAVADGRVLTLTVGRFQAGKKINYPIFLSIPADNPWKFEHHTTHDLDPVAVEQLKRAQDHAAQWQVVLLIGEWLKQQIDAGEYPTFTDVYTRAPLQVRGEPRPVSQDRKKAAIRAAGKIGYFTKKDIPQDGPRQGGKQEYLCPVHPGLF